MKIVGELLSYFDCVKNILKPFVALQSVGHAKKKILPSFGSSEDSHMTSYFT